MSTPTLDPLREAVARLARTGWCVSPSFSPDGAQIAFVSNLSGLPQVWTVPTAGGWPTQVTATEDQVQAVAWSPTGEWLAFVAAPGGGLNSQIYVTRPDGSDVRRLSQGGRDNNWLGPWTPDGRALAVASSRRTPSAMDNYLVTPDGEWELVAENQGVGRVLNASRDGRQVVVARVEYRGDNNLFLVNRADGRETLLTPHEPPGFFGGGVLSPDGQTIYLSSNDRRENRAFARVQLAADGTPGPIEVLAGRDDAELDEFEVTEDGLLAALVWNVSGQSELHLFDLRTHQTVETVPLNIEIVQSPTFSRDGQRLAFMGTGAAAPQDIWVYNRTTQQLTQVTHSPHPGVNLDTLVRPELVCFPAHDGLALTGWVYLPHQFVSPGPVVIVFHGGPEAQERPGFRSAYQALLTQGMAVFAPNVRGSAGFGKTFVNLDNGPLRVDAVRDIQTCVDYVVRRGVADPRRIGITGGSYGGFMTMAGLTTYPDLFAAGVTICGVVNFETFFAHTEPWMAAISKVEYGDPDTQADLLRQLSPIHKIDRVRAPTMVQHGANDTNVPVMEADQVVDNLKRRGIPVEYVLFPDEGHGFRKTANSITSTVALVHWFAQHLAAR